MPSKAGNDDVELALEALRSVVRDMNATAASRSSAARTVLEYYGFLGTGRAHVPDLTGKAHTELSLPELKRRVQELRGGDSEKAQLAQDTALFDP